MLTISSPAAWWKRDTALHSFVFVQFLINFPFATFNTYVLYQLQVVGFLIGTDNEGLPCTGTYCIVPWAGTRLDLNSVLLYLNALSFGLGGAVTLFLCAYSDFWSQKHLLVTFFIICYGALAIPAYWLQDVSEYKFKTLTGLYVGFNIVTLILIAVLNIYIPHCMRKSIESADVSDDTGARSADTVPAVASTAASTKRRYGFNMTAFGLIANALGSITMFVIVIILAQTLSDTDSQSSGLIVTTVTGFVTIVGSLVALFGLPPIPAKSSSRLKGISGPIVEFVMPFKDFATHKNLAVLLVSYTIYTDSTFAVNSAISQLFVAEIKPNTTEISLYALTQSLFSFVCTMAFLWIRPRLRVRLETWLIIGYSLILILPIWAFIGFANVDFGFKRRWEFYAQYFVFNLSGAFVNTSFRVLFSELVPVANEVRWFGMQLVLSCATVWVNYVASGPLQNATHQLRFPMVISLVFLFIALVLELCRTMLPMFKADMRKWYQIDQDSASDDAVPHAETTKGAEVSTSVKAT